MNRRYLLMSVLFVLVAAKFLWPLFVFHIPLGYDPGIYRYLFIRYADALGNFSLPDLPPWAKEHPVGLFMLAAPFIKLGLPVDWLLGWMWNFVPVLVLLTLAWVMTKREGAPVGITVLLTGLLSAPFYDGFFAMYWKVYAALFFLVLTYHFFEKRSLWFAPLALLTIITHHQTGLILILVMATWWILSIPSSWRDPTWRLWTILFGCIGLAAILFYLPNWERALWSPFKSVILLRGDDAPGGSFPEALFYLRTTGILLALGVGGFLYSFRKERFSVWQLSVLWCAAFVFFKLVFYRRFFLQLDFFLLPFAASALVFVWNKWHSFLMRGAMIVLVAAQGYWSYQVMVDRTPNVDKDTLTIYRTLPLQVPEGATVIALENESAFWLRGWLPYHTVGGPGVLDYPGWTYEDWEKFIYGTHAERQGLLSSLPEETYFVITPIFLQYYGNDVYDFLADTCFEEVPRAPLLKSVCST